MKINLLNVVLGLAFVSAASTANAAVTDIDAGTINFDGQVIASPCVVTSADTNQSVTLADVEKGQFYNGSDANATVGKLGQHAKEFTIHLEQCDTSQEQNVTFKFKGDTDPANAEVLKNTASTNAATGVGVALFEDDGTTKVIVDVDNPLPLVIPTANAAGEKTFKVDYIATQNQVTVGDVKSNATFDVTFN